MTVNQKKYPPCFADLDTVFPQGADGLRHSPESCMPCCYKTECLRQAMSRKDGIKVREEIVDRAYASGVMGFLDRWSRKKALRAKSKKYDQG